MIDTLTPRHWFMHTRHAVIGMGGNVQARTEPPALPPPRPSTRPLHVGLVAGDDAMWATAADSLELHFSGDPNLKAEQDWVNDFDCLVLLGWPAVDDRRRLKQIELHCRGGGSLLALRALHAEMPGWCDFAEEVFGGRQTSTRQPRLMEIERSDVAWHHPVLAGVENLIAEGEVYRGPRLAPAATILLTADDGRGHAPVAWTTRHAGGRVFCSTLGHDDDFRQAAFLRLISNAIHWAAVAPRG